MRILIWFILIAIVVTGGGALYLHATSEPAFDYRTATVRRGDLVSTVSATGTLEPEEVVDVGAQVAGLIVSFGKDLNGNLIDYRSPVDAGMVLARIDDTTYQADLESADAGVEQATTAVQKGQADLELANSKLLEAEHNWRRAEKIGPSDALSQNDYDMYQADFETAKATVSIAEAEIATAKSGVSLAKAEQAKAKRALDFCTITSPVKGVIIDRRVNVGQTVVSSLNTPSLFLIGKDLRQMQIWASVNEADIGQIIPGAPVTFRCDAFPDKVFNGKVGKIRLNASLNQNVVLYTVEVEADNSKNILLPYLTARVEFEVKRETNQLIVPNMALRWSPTAASEVAPDFRAKWKPAGDDDEDAIPQPRAGHSKPGVAKQVHGTVWVTDGAFVRPINVTLGITDRIDTVVHSDELKDGTNIVIGDIPQGSGGGTSTDPFMPQMHHHW
jgi:HlyD family secretion protein